MIQSSFFRLLLLAIIIMGMACKKNSNVFEPPIEPEPIYLSDTQTIKLKTLVAQGLPSPYFGFTYDDSGYVTTINFGSGFHQYELEYKNGRLQKMVNIKSEDTLKYHYLEGRIAAVMQYTVRQTKNASYKMQYNEHGKLVSMLWFDFNENFPLDSVPTRQVLLQYHADGNLAKKDEFRADSAGTFNWTGSVEYSNYDKGINVDAFGLLKDSFDDFIFLPQVKLQKDNPLTVISKGVINDSKISYTYNYVNGLPTDKKGIMEFTRGADSGKVFNFTNRFTY
jgi:hypothetical protein